MKNKLDLQRFSEGVGDKGDAGVQGQKGLTGAQGDPGYPGPGMPPKTGPEPKEPDAGKKYTDDDVNKIIDRKFAEWQTKQEKAIAEAEKLAEMNATQKAEYERDELQRKLDELTRKDTLTEMGKTARKMFEAKGINLPDELTSMLITEDADSTKVNVDTFGELFLDAVQKAVAEKLGGKPPKSGANPSTMTKEQIMAIKDPDLRQKTILENRALFDI